jgi:hypothetical protein
MISPSAVSVVVADISPVYYFGNGFFGWRTGIGRKNSACCDVDDIFAVWQARTEQAYRDRDVMRVIAGKIEAAS